MLINLFQNLLGRRRRAADTTRVTLTLARELLAQSRREEVIDVLDLFIEGQPDQAEARFLRGTAILELQRAAEAVPDLTRASELNPREPRYLYNLAVAHWILGHSARTMELCRMALTLSAFDPARILLANIELHGEDYVRVLARIHDYLKPRTYVEIGVFCGASLRVVRPDTVTLGVDPAPRLEKPAGPNQRVFAETSDNFFAAHDVIAELGGRRVELAFVDGMHLFEYALRDFINIERLCNRDSIVLLHDCYPLNALTAARERFTGFWSGDIWRLMLLLKKYRPDLSAHTIATPPTGLGVILNLDPSSPLLGDNFDRIVAEYLAMDYSVLDASKQELLSLCPNDWPAIQTLLDSRYAP